MEWREGVEVECPRWKQRDWNVKGEMEIGVDREEHGRGQDRSLSRGKGVGVKKSGWEWK